MSPASGFQSKQFRMLENTLGLSEKQRIQHSGCPYLQHLRPEDQDDVQERADKAPLLHLVGRWLESLLASFEADGFDFCDFMRGAITQAAEHDRAAIRAHRGRIGVSEEKCKLAELDKKLEAHLRLYDEKEHQKLIDTGIRQLSFKATMSCVFVHSYRQELPLAGVYQILNGLVEIDELIAQWRQRHSLIVLRMIGSKSGTGGSSGHAYLNQVMARSRIFVDLCHATHYLLPQHAMPDLPGVVQLNP